MSVYEQTYKPYSGTLTPRWSRLLIIPRYAYSDVFQSKIFIAFFAASFIPFVVMAIIIYLHHNANALALFGIKPDQFIPINSTFFLTYCQIQHGFVFLLAVVIGPVLISRDLANNALPLYLARPITRAEYISGKLCVLAILMSAMSWIPGLVLFFMQSILEGGWWFIHNLKLAGGVLLANIVYIAVLSLLALALSAWVKWRLAGSAALLALFIIPSGMTAFIDLLFRTMWGSLMDPGYLLKAITYWSFGASVDPIAEGFSVPPVWISWLLLAAFCAFCLAVLSKKVRAYEVIQ